MKILVDEMPTKVEDCLWSSPIKDPWKDRTFWFCDWSLSKSTETCPMVNGGECPYFKQDDFNRIASMLSMIFLKFINFSHKNVKKGINL